MKSLIWIILSLVILESDRIFPQDIKPAIADTTLANEYFLKAEKLAQKAQYDSSIYYFQKALHIRSRILDENDLMLAQLNMNLGTVHHMARHYEAALHHLKKALQIFLKAEDQADPVNLANNYSSLAKVYRDINNYDVALQFSKKSLNLKLELFGENHESVVWEYNRIGIVYRKKGDHGRAIEYFTRGLSIALTLFTENHPGPANFYNNIGNVYSDQRDYGKAIEYYKNALEIELVQPNPNYANIAIRYHNIGNTYWLLDDFEKALEYLEKGLSGLQSELGENHPWTAMSYTVISWTYADLGDYDNAIEMINKSLNIRLNLFGRHHEGTAQSYLGLAAAYDKQGDFRTALKWSQEALMALSPGFTDSNVYVNPTLEKTISEAMLFWALKCKAEIFRRYYERESHGIRDLQMSLSTYELESELLDQMRVGYRAEGSKLSRSLDASQIHDKAIQTAIELDKLTGDEQYKRRAFFFSAKSKAAVLSEAFQESKAREFGEVSETALRQVENLRTSLTDFETQLQKEKLKDEEADTLRVQELEGRVFALKLEYDRLMQDLERNFPDYYDLKYQTQVASIEAVQKILNENTAMMDYFVGEETIFIFLITKSNFEVKTVAKDPSFASMVSEVHNSIKKLDTKKYLRASHQLYNEIVKPVEREIASKKKLIIIPDGILLKIPFEALLIQEPSETEELDFTELNYFVKHFEISYHYSANLFLNILQKDHFSPKRYPKSKGGFLGFAPVFSDQEQAGYVLSSNYPVQDFEFADAETRAATIDGQRFRELKYSQTEVESLIKEFEKHGRAGVAFFHADASEENFKKQARNYRYIHVATHGLIHADEPRLSGLIFSQPTDSTAEEDGILYSAETYNLELNADLLTLSSCESGIGKLVRGEGLMALTRGFLYSGASNIIVSLWKVSDKHTSQLMLDLYKNILSGKGYAQSLREAKLRMLKKPATAFPKSWSSFVLIGK